MANEFNFKYMPLEGRLPGRDFEQQTEDVINDLGRRIVTIESESSEASALAKEAYDKAVEAASTADSAQSAAANAQSTADDAIKQAESANSAAQAANDAANEALTAATEATATADKANETAEAAQSTANNALDTANSANETAENANSTAEAANTTALNAITLAQTLTSYENIGFDDDEDDEGDEYDLDDYYEFARLHTSTTVANIPVADTEFFVDVDENSDENKVRQTATTVDGSATYIRWGTISEDEETEEKSVAWGAWSQGSGGGSSLTEIIGLTPNYYKRASLFGTSATSVTVYANTQVNIGNKGYISQVDTVLSLDAVATAANRAGKDVYIYAVQGSGTEPDFVLSLNSTVPDGYNADNSRKIGGFHCECAAVGTISGHPYSGMAAGDIIDISAWDLLHRAVAENEGMVYIAGMGIWVDIYLTSYDGTQLASIYNAVPLTGYTSPAFHGAKFVEYAGLIGKRLTWYNEFTVYAKGSNEGTLLGALPSVTGGNSDTAGRRMVSNYALEDCCGSLYQWTGDIYGGFSATASSTTYQYGGVNTGESNFYFDGASWIDKAVNPDVDGDEKYGKLYYGMGRCLAGCRGNESAENSGSRSADLNHLSAARNTNFGCRLASEPRVVNL